MPYDSVLLVGYGGPEKMEDVRPFLGNVLQGRRVAPERVDEVVRSIDVAPTLMELMGLQPPGNMEGVSLAGCFDGRPAPRLRAFNETGIWLTDLPGMPEHHLRYPDIFELLEIPDKTSGTLAIKDEYMDRIIQAKDRMIRSENWKLVYQPLIDGAHWQLFDAMKDPQFRYNVLRDFPEVVEPLQRALLGWIEKDRAWRGARYRGEPSMG